MTTADIWPQLPSNPTGWFVVCLSIVIAYLLLRAYTANQQVQINGLRESLDKQADRHSEEMREMREKITRLEETTEDARTERHRLRGELASYRMAVSLVAHLYTNCTCGALAPISAVLTSLNEQELETE